MPLAPHLWEIQPGQTLAQSSEGIMCIKYIAITPDELQFFYILKSRQRSIPHIIALSSLMLPARQTRLIAKVQILGQLEEYDSGVIHVAYTSQPGQIILLQMSLTSNHHSSWQLAPLKQVNDDPHKSTSWMGMLTDCNAFPEVEWYGPMKKEQVSLFRKNKPEHRGENIPHIYFRMDDPVQISLLTQDEYRTIVGLENESL